MKQYGGFDGIVGKTIEESTPSWTTPPHPD